MKALQRVSSCEPLAPCGRYEFINNSADDAAAIELNASARIHPINLDIRTTSRKWIVRTPLARFENFTNAALTEVLIKRITMPHKKIQKTAAVTAVELLTRASSVAFCCKSK